MIGANVCLQKLFYYYLIKVSIWIYYKNYYIIILLKSLFEFQLLGECHCWWTSESPRAHMLPSSTVDFGWFVAFGEHQNFPCLKLIEIVILLVHYTIPFGVSFFWHFLVITYQLFILNVWLRITDEDSVPEMSIWSISRIYSDWKWRIHLSKSLFLNWHEILLEFLQKVFQKCTNTFGKDWTINKVFICKHCHEQFMVINIAYYRVIFLFP